ncbi:hypothetical protein [Vibrio cyclitrophicus]|uniref:hypothetical protein n=1 Tax=Vibrio cyclitrophicus TaxID=47951 RepID=UPI000C83AFC0|nr:hypothetical protein [Vibrio cyclitrophicus]PMH46941.1 hypothetical protein BCU67_21300 [Vibrio cyclitrophicus]
MFGQKKPYNPTLEKKPSLAKKILIGISLYAVYKVTMLFTGVPTASTTANSPSCGYYLTGDGFNQSDEYTSLLRTASKYFESDARALGYTTKQLKAFSSSTTIDNDEMFLYRDNDFAEKCLKDNKEKSVTIMRSALMGTFIKYHNK